MTDIEKLKRLPRAIRFEIAPQAILASVVKSFGSSKPTNDTDPVQAEMSHSKESANSSHHFL
jgi:hypothetical protein